MEDWEKELMETKPMKKAKAKKPAKVKVLKVKAKQKPKKLKAAAPRGKGKQKPAPNGTVIVNYRVTREEAARIRSKANKLTNGNVTQLVRRAVLAWKPTDKEVANIRRTTYA